MCFKIILLKSSKCELIENVVKLAVHKIMKISAPLQVVLCM